MTSTDISKVSLFKDPAPFLTKKEVATKTYITTTELSEIDDLIYKVECAATHKDKIMGDKHNIEYTSNLNKILDIVCPSLNCSTPSSYNNMDIMKKNLRLALSKFFRIEFTEASLSYDNAVQELRDRGVEYIPADIKIQTPALATAPIDYDF